MSGSILPFLRAPGKDTAVVPGHGNIEHAVRLGSHAFVEHVQVLGMPCLEVEYRLGHVPRSLYDAVIQLLEQQGARWAGGERTVSTDRRQPGAASDVRLTRDEGGNVQWMTKARVWMTHVHEGVARPIKLCMSSEIPLDPGSNTLPAEEDLTIYRTKTRKSWTYACWRLDVTDVSTNDPAFRDADDLLEIELELVRDHDLILYYDTPTLLRWGFEIIDSLVRAASSPSS
jgi:hypothetical protein